MGRARWMARLERWFDRHIVLSIESAFYHHGLLCASNPFVVIGMAILTATLISIPSSKILFRASLTEGHSGYGSNNYHIWSSDQRLSNLTSIEAPHWLRNVADVRPTRVLQLSFLPANGSSIVMSRPFIRKIGFEMPQKLVEYTTAIDGVNYSLRNFCTAADEDEPTGGCLIHHPGAIWNWNETEFEQDTLLSHIIQYPDKGQTTMPRGIPTTASATAFGPSDEPDALNMIPKGALFGNLVTVPLFQHVSASSATILLSLKPIGKTPDIEDIFFDRLWENLQIDSPQLKSRYTYLRYSRNEPRHSDQVLIVFVYCLVFFYIYLTIAQFEFVKSKFGLGVAGVIILLYSTMMAVGLCTKVGLITTVTAIELLPFLVVSIGLDNMTVITSSIVSKWGLPIRFQVAEGLAKAGPQLMKSLLSMEIMLLLGVYSRISALQEFCAIASVAILCDFLLEVVLYVSVLSLDIRRVELSDFSRPWFMKAVSSRNQNEETVATNPTPTSRARKDQKVSVMGCSMFMVIGGVGAVIFALLFGASTTGSKSLLPNMFVDWRKLLIGSGYEEDSLIEFIPFTIEITTDSLVDSRSYLSPVSLVPFTSDKISSIFNQHIIIFGGVLFLGSFLVSKLSKYLRRMVFGERDGIDLVEAFGTIQNFDIITFAGHKQDIECIEVVSKAFGPKAKFASACLGGQVRVWDGELSRCVEVLHCRPDSSAEDGSMTPWCLCTNDTFVGVGYANGSMQIWDLATRAMVELPPAGPLPGEGEPTLFDGGAITCAELFDNCLLSGSSTGVLQLWNWSYGKSTTYGPATLVVQAKSEVPIRNSSVYDLKSFAENDSSNNRLTFSCTTSKAFHNSGVSVLKVTEDIIISASNDKVIRIFNKSLTPIKSLYGHENGITCLDVYSDTLVSGSTDKTVKVWSIRDGSLVKDLKGHVDSIVAVCVNQWHIVSSSEDDTIRVWNIQDWSCSNIMKESSPIALHSSSILITAGDGTLTAWDLLGLGERLRTLPLIENCGPFNKTSGSMTTNHIILHGDKVVCDIGWQLKCVTLPFPKDAERKLKGP